MRVLGASDIENLAPMASVIDCLQEAFATGCVAPLRTVTRVPGGAGDRLLLSMPAFAYDGGGSVKLVSYFPDNPSRGLPTIHAVVVVFSEAGEPIAVLDGSMITHLRTGAASALASRFLSREDSSHLLIVGTGALAPAMAEAHCTVRAIKRVSVWGRSAERATATAAAIAERLGAGIQVEVAAVLEHAVASADIVSCATASATPLVAGKWLRAGTFVDAVGSFSPSKRETDDDVVRRARIFVDTYAGALAEGGDIVDPLARGVIDRSRVEGELSDLVCGRCAGRAGSDEIILFKSVGAAIEDLAIAKLVVRERNLREAMSGNRP